MYAVAVVAERVGWTGRQQGTWVGEGGGVEVLPRPGWLGSKPEGVLAVSAVSIRHHREVGITQP